MPSAVSTGAGVRPAPDIRFTLRALGSLKSLHLVVFALAMPLGPQLARVLGFEPWQHGVFSAAYPLSACAAGFAVLFLSDRFAGRRSLAAVTIGYGVALLGCAVAADFVQLVICRAVSGAFGGLLCAWLPISVMRATPPAQQRAALRRSLAWVPAFGIALALPFLLLTSNILNWRASFAVPGALVLLFAPLLRRIPPLRHPAFERHASERQLTVLMHHPRNRLAFFVGGLLAASSSLMVTFFSGLIVVNAGFSEQALPVFFLIGGTSAVIALPAFERWAAGDNPFSALLIVSGAAAATYVTLASLGPASWIVVLPIAVLFMITNAARFAPASALVNLHLKPRYTARYLGLGAVIQQGAAGLGFFTASMFITHPAGQPLLGFPKVAFAAGVLLAIAVWLASRLERHPKGPHTAVPLIREAAAN